MHICNQAHRCIAPCAHRFPHNKMAGGCAPSRCYTLKAEAACVPYAEEARQLEHKPVKYGEGSHIPTRIFQTANSTEVAAKDFAQVEAKVAAYLMSKDELFALHQSTTAACLEVMKKKNHDYTSGGSVFANFKDSSILGIPPVMGVLLRCIDKFKRIQTHCTRGKLVVEGEGVLDAVDDVINYMILAKGMLIEESKNK